MEISNYVRITIRLLVCFIFCFSGLIIPDVQAREYFSDLKTLDTFFQYIDSLKHDAVIDGYSNGQFKSNEYVTRGQMAKFVKQGFGISTNTSCMQFSDVSTQSQFYVMIQSLKCFGVITGFQDGTYRENDLVSRSQAMKFIMNAARTATNNPNFFASSGNNVFSDLNNTNVFYQYVIDGYYAGIISGVNGRFYPDEPITRGAMAKVVALSRMKSGIGTYQEVAFANDSTQSRVLDNIGRTFDIKFPPNFDPKILHPLIIALHPSGTNAQEFENMSGLTPLAKNNNYIVVYPNGTSSNIFQTGYVWNAYGLCCGSARDNEFLMNIIRELELNFAVDRQRIYMIGFSGGAMFEYGFAGLMADEIAAFSIISGAVGGTPPNGNDLIRASAPNGTTSVLLIHGSDDSTIPINGGTSAFAPGHSINFLSYADSEAYWTNANGCSLSAPLLDVTSENVQGSKYINCKDMKNVYVYQIIGGRHIWPVESEVLNQKLGINATEVSLNFFEANKKLF